MHFQAGAAPTRIKQLNLSNCNGSTMEFEPGEYYIENASWQQSCHLKVAATGGNSGSGNSTSVKLYFKNAFNLGSGPTCWNISGSTTCGNSMTPAQIATQTPDKLKVYLYSGNFTTAQRAQIAAGIYVDQGDINLTAANNFVFAGDLFARNISISNGGPTSLLYKPVFTSIIPPANSTPPTVSIVQPTPPVIAGVPANSNFIAPASIGLTATATAAAGNTISKVEFYQGATLIGTATAPTVTNGTNYGITWSNVIANSYSITAKETDNKNSTTSAAPITVNVINNTPPTISLTASPANATAPATIILNATAADTDGTISKVEFFNGATSIATVTQSPYKTNWENVAQGNYSITAKATDNLGATTISAPVPVAVTKNVPKMYDIHTDHLNTPRVITDNTGTEVWRWDSAPFGETLPNEQPQNNVSKFVWNQRFPGQYYDEETGLHYNYFRDYDPSTGRYAQSDPIGLGGGINTFGYVNGNPSRGSDSFGLIIHLQGYNGPASPDEQKAYETAKQYLMKDPGMKAVIDRLDKSSKILTVYVTKGEANEYDSKAGIFWNPNLAVCIVDKNRNPTGGTQSPAMGLGHEFGHADGSSWFGNFSDSEYDTREERRVIEGLETNAAKTLGEGVRKNHDGIYKKVKTPLSRDCDCSKN